MCLCISGQRQDHEEQACKPRNCAILKLQPNKCVTGVKYSLRATSVPKNSTCLHPYPMLVFAFACLCLPAPDLHQTPVSRRRPAYPPSNSMQDQCNSKHSSTILCSILCNMLNCFEGGDSVLPKTQSRISAFIIRERANYIFLSPGHKTRRKLRFAQSEFRRPNICRFPAVLVLLNAACSCFCCCL